MKKKPNKQKDELALLLETPNQPKIPKVGDIVMGTVLNVSKNEIHLDIDGMMTGVVRGKEIIDESANAGGLRVADTVQATVLELENERGELELSIREAGHVAAWNRLNELKKTGEVLNVPILDANKGGLIIRIGQVEGFLPVSQLTVEHYPRVEGGDKNRILEILKSYMGKEFRVKVLDVDEAEEKLIVSERAAWEESQQGVIAGYKIGDTIEGRVSGVADFGAFVEFGENLEGLVHISELAWQRIDHPRDVIKTGDSVTAKIIDIDRSKFSLSMKALKEDPWKKAIEKYRVGQVVKGKVMKINPFGLFVELDKEIHGLAHISELADKKVQNPSELVRVGDILKFKILNIDPDHHRLGLSLKAANVKQEKQEQLPAEGAIPQGQPKSA